MELATSRERVKSQTPAHINQRIEMMTRSSIEYYRQHPEEIPQRLRVLDEEWDVERALETNASSLILAGLGAGFLFSRKFLVLPVAVSGFLLQHGLQGWCPPLPILRRMGFRTRMEIEEERQALTSIQSGGSSETH
ncbi:hypothetical protein ACXYTJ_15465 [Gilvimarinus sp. F26214L]|uniref:hypothetical protein n=1 Tax=Gilvimarinus sp. DZF01 TaxID=3461371 RepID=UPI004045C5DC